MNNGKGSSFLWVTTLISLFLLPFAIFKRPLKDWIIVFLVSCIGNAFVDRWLVSKGYIKYKVRPLPERFLIHLPFDFVQYPLALLYYNQWTLNSGPTGIMLKIFPFIIPQMIIEYIAEKESDLITWKKGWKWYHSFSGMLLKFLLCRMIIGVIRMLNTKENSIT